MPDTVPQILQKVNTTGPGGPRALDVLADVVFEDRALFVGRRAEDEA